MVIPIELLNFVWSVKSKGLWQHILFQICFTFYGRICQWKQEERFCLICVIF